MEPTPAVSRIVQRMPNLLTLFFSISLVQGFKALSDYYHWTTDPVFNFRDVSHLMMLLSFATTLYFVVSVWLAFNVLIERNPYSLSFGRFYFDVARFALMFALLMWSFLVVQPGKFHWYILGFGAWHLLMAIWYAGQRQTAQGDARRERGRDLRIHGTVSAMYFVLGALYWWLVAARWEASQPVALQIGLALAVFLIVIVWTTQRLADLRMRLLAEAGMAAHAGARAGA